MYKFSDTSLDIQRGWSNGSVIANAQNFARWLMETPSNHMTPSAFVDAVSTRLGNLESDVKSKLEIMPRYCYSIVTMSVYPLYSFV